jgi:hypothetical protein
MEPVRQTGQSMAVTLLLVLFSSLASGQTPANEAATTTDIFILGGSDLIRPGLLPRANLGIGIGHTFSFLKKDPFGDELTFGYTYENGGTHGFWHTQYGGHTESIGLIKNFSIGKLKNPTFYTLSQIGVISMTGNSKVLNRLSVGESFGAALHINKHNSICVQGAWNKVMTVTGYPTTSIGYTYSR